MWNGTAETLKASPAKTNTSPNSAPMLRPSPADRPAAIRVNSVEPTKP
jgi:hypothetical protein